MTPLFRQYDRFEDGLIARFRQHPFFGRIRSMGDAQFVAYLIQLSRLSLEFVKWEETAKLGLRDERAAELVRYIVREEIPQRGPTHKDCLLQDLEAIGVTAERFRQARTSWRTRQTVWGLYGLVRFPRPDYDLRTLVALRVAGEVMVAETYRHVTAELERRFGLPAGAQAFYAPHFLHDQKGSQEAHGEDSHADAFAQLLSELIVNERTLAVATRTAEQAMRVRWRFHDQFGLPYRTGMAASLSLGGATACLALTAVTAQVTKAPDPHAEYQAFLAAHPDCRAMAMDVDAILLAKARRTGDPRLYAAVGTSKANALIDCWP